MEFVNGGIPVGLAGVIYSIWILAMNGNNINTSFNTLISNVSHLEVLMSVMVAGFFILFCDGYGWWTYGFCN